MNPASNATGPYHAPYWPTTAPIIHSNISNHTGNVPDYWACDLPDIDHIIEEFNHGDNLDFNLHHRSILEVMHLDTKSYGGA